MKRTDRDSELRRLYGISLKTLEQMYEEWTSGAAKSVLENKYLETGKFHGKRFTRLVKKYLGIDTEQPRGLQAEVTALRERVQQLEDVLEQHGIRPPPL